MYRNFNAGNFENDLACSDLCKENVFMLKSVIESVELYNSILDKLFDKHCPVISKWYNTRLQTMKKYLLMKMHRKIAKRYAKPLIQF